MLGYLAVRSRSLLPGVIFHFLNISLMVLSAKVTPELIERVPVLGFLAQPSGDGPGYQWPVYLFGGVTSLAILGWFAWFPEARTRGRFAGSVPAVGQECLARRYGQGVAGGMKIVGCVERTTSGKWCVAHGGLYFENICSRESRFA